MEFVVSGQYLDEDVILIWQDGDLSGTPFAVQHIKSLDGALVNEVGGQLLVFDLSDHELAYNFLMGLVEDAQAGGDVPFVDVKRIY